MSKISEEENYWSGNCRCESAIACDIAIKALEQSDKINEVLMVLEEMKCEYDCTANEFQRGANAGATFVKNKAIDIIKDKLGVKEAE